MAINTTTISGRLTKDPEVKATKTGKSVCTFTVAVDKKPKNAGTNFIDCVAWEGRGETISKYFKKGSLIGITGRLDQQSWEQGGMKRSKIVIIVDDFAFLELRKKTPEEEAEKILDSTEEITIDDIPF